MKENKNDFKPYIPADQDSSGIYSHSLNSWYFTCSYFWCC